MREACEREVVEFHEFVERWLAGRVPDTDANYERARTALADDFEMVVPSGESHSGSAVLAGMREAHGIHADADPPLNVSVREVRHRLSWDDLCLLTYQEWQRWGDEETGRQSSVLLRERGSTPNGVEWVHLHETWLSEGRSR